MRRSSQLTLLLATTLIAAACGPQSGDDGQVDASVVDARAQNDGSVPSDGSAPRDASRPDGGPAQDAGPAGDARVAQPDAGPLDTPVHGSLGLAGSFNAWALADPAAALSYRGGGLWAADVNLPIGRVDFKLVADGAWTVNWGGGQAGLVPAQRGQGVQDGANLGFEIPVAGAYHVSLDERTGAWSIAPAASLGPGLPAPAAALIALLKTLPDLAPAAAASQVDAFTTAQRTAQMPVVMGDSALFLSLDPVPAGGPLALAGSWSGWATGQVTMVPLAGRAAYLARGIGPAVRASYKLVVGGVWQRDPGDPEIEWDAVPRAGYGDFNSVFATAGYVWTGPHLELLHVTPVALSSGTRDVYVWLPPGYDGETRRYPTLYVHDGNESLTRAHFDQVATDEMTAGRAAKAILVFVHLPSGDVRMSEYTFASAGTTGDQYRDFIADQLVPLIDGRYRTLASRNARAQIGESLGGLISYYIAYERADLFARVGGMSSSFFWASNALITEIQNGPKQDLVKCYLDSGSPDDNYDVTTQMNGVLMAKGYTTDDVVAPGAQHDWPFWQQRFPGALDYLFPPAEFP